MTQNKGFEGMTVAAFESRMATEMTRLIIRYGGRPFVAPALREIPIQDNPAALRFGARLIDGQVDTLILMTGIGTTILFDILRSRHPMSSIMTGLKQTAIVGRGPTSVAALKTLGITPTLTVPEPNTWIEVVSTLDEYRPVKGLRVAVQEYGTSNPDLLEALRQRGAEVFPVPIYRWALPVGTKRECQRHRWASAGRCHVTARAPPCLREPCPGCCRGASTTGGFPGDCSWDRRRASGTTHSPRAVSQQRLRGRDARSSWFDVGRGGTA